MSASDLEKALDEAVVITELDFEETTAWRIKQVAETEKPILIGRVGRCVLMMSVDNPMDS